MTISYVLMANTCLSFVSPAGASSAYVSLSCHPIARLAFIFYRKSDGQSRKCYKFVSFTQLVSLVLSLTQRKYTSPSQRRRHHSLDGVHPVFGLIEHDGLGTFKHVVGDLHGGEAELIMNLPADGGVQVVESG